MPSGSSSLSSSSSCYSYKSSGWAKVGVAVNKRALRVLYMVFACIRNGQLSYI